MELAERFVEASGPLEHLQISGEALRNLIHGHAEERYILPTQGIEICNSTIVGDIDLRGCEVKTSISLIDCEILGVVDFSSASTKDIVLKGSNVEKLTLSEIRCNGSIILSYGFRTFLPVYALGAKITGQLGCSGGSFHGSPLAISLERAEIVDCLFWRHIKGLWGIVDLTSAKVGTLVDDPDSWPRKGCLRIDGFVYEAIGSNTSTDYFDRLPWLSRQYEPHLTYDFRPQPFEQLAKVLNNSGRLSEAKEISIQRLSFQRHANYLRREPRYIAALVKLRHSRNILEHIILAARAKELKPTFLKDPFTELLGWISWIKSFIFWIVSGYGYKPIWCLYWIGAFILVGWYTLSNLYEAGNIVPNNPILLAREWKLAAEANLSYPYGDFFNYVPDYPKFYPLGYALDVFIPFVDLAQEKYWAVQNRADSFGGLLQRILWLYICIGWVLSAIFAASISGFVRR